MKKAKIIITVKDKGNGKIEFQCQCQNGHSQILNELVNHVANELPKTVHEQALIFYKNMEQKHAIH
ncbi:hypothetical protein IB292_03490 [Vibrio parahaemolyticus]|uniref:Uncharacterized protein n=1 Tax=Vibrio parahaemolyticus TaxID=670 RepID=A0A9Q3UB84_VIBPH|nr:MULTISPECIES: hypothetical protein [Vibrio]EGQ9150174.1 hypothetical protein [Vibrio parahaemolyticus]MBN8107728.1 hypothetical protein [Vibrio vulnificus]MCC3804096.1 hypothetical protein [Vibrio parahaemolyticus]